MSHEDFHEPASEVDETTRDLHRAVASLMEELEAVDWYQQRVEATKNEDLQRILAHNRDEEKEHVAMILEWLRRRDAHLDEQLRTYLFTQADITHVEDADTGSIESSDESLGIGSLRQKENEE